MKPPKTNGRVAISVVAPGDSKNITDKDAAEMGMVKLDKASLATMKDLGIDVEKAGVATMDRGFAYIVKNGAKTLIEKLEAKAAQEGATLDDLLGIAGAFSKLARAMADIISKTSAMGDDRPKDNAPRRTFSPNQTAQFPGTMIKADHLHIHEAPNGKH